MISNWFRDSSLRATVAASSLSLLMLCGCPTAQVPATPNQNENTNTSSGDSGTDGDVLPRPIPPVIVDTTTTTGTSGGGTGSGSGGSSGGSGGGSGGSGSVFTAVNAPSSLVKVRPGTAVSIGFNLSDPSGALTKAEIIAARDADADGKADAAPILVRQIATANGSNTTPLATNDPILTGALVNGFGRFVAGIRTTTTGGDVVDTYAAGGIIIDSIAPTSAWIAPAGDNLMTREGTFTVQLNSSDNASHTVRVLLDRDNAPESGNEFEFAATATFAAGSATRTFSAPLNAFPSGSYRFYVIVSDGIAPPVAYYAPNLATGTDVILQITNRLVGDFNLEALTNSDNGAIMQGFNFNDLAGSSISTVPDVNGDGRDELIIGSRFGKPYLIENSGVGFGEAYMFYGSAQRLRGIRRLNSAGTQIPGLIFSGVRTPKNVGGSQNSSTRWTKGMSDITVIPDMDGDELPEIVFSFPRAESISLGQSNPAVQHPELFPDLAGMGDLEFDAMTPFGWTPNVSQFTRGGIVIVSSSNEIIRNQNVLNRKSDRVFDLHETGQLFSGMARPGLVPYVRQALTRTQIDGGLFIVGADCDLQPPQGWEPGDLGDPLDPMDDTPGTCGDDGVPTPAGLGDGTIDDGREATLERWFLFYDTIFTNQGPGGFHQPWTVPPADPPLANASQFPWPHPQFFGRPNIWYRNACFVQGNEADGCEVTSNWFSWSNPFVPYPCTSILGGNSAGSIGGTPLQTPTDCYPNNPPGPFIVNPDPACEPLPPELCPPPAVDAAADQTAIWTGFYAPGVIPYVSTATGESFPTPIGARILGQKVDDEFGTTVAADNNWLYISAPKRTANDAPYDTDIPGLPGSRTASGIVYQLRTRAALTGSPYTRTQLWMERGTRTVPGPNPGDPDVTVQLGWPNVDAQIPGRTDYTMPVPHQYIIENVGSLRGNPAIGIIDTAYPADTGGGGGTQTCPPGFDPDVDQADADTCGAYTPYPVGTSGYYMERTPQIVGPHADAKISFVKALGDLNDDGIRDFAVGSEFVKTDVVNGTGTEVGAVFIVYGRPTGVEGDYLLEQLALAPSDQNRLAGVLLRGASAGEKLARVFDDAGDVNNDGIADVIIGNEGADGNAGEAIIILGSPNLTSPAGGWTVDDAVASGNAIRIRGAAAGDLAGANVSGAGDVDGDNISDILVAAPGALGGKGAVYLIYGSETLGDTLNLAEIGTVRLPGARLIGRVAGDFLGGGAKDVTDTDPNGGTTTAFSRGVARLGDIDGDGRADYAIGSMLASPGGKSNAGEVYVLYGRGD